MAFAFFRVRPLSPAGIVRGENEQLLIEGSMSASSKYWSEVAKVATPAWIVLQLLDATNIDRRARSRPGSTCITPTARPDSAAMIQPRLLVCLCRDHEPVEVILLRVLPEQFDRLPKTAHISCDMESRTCLVLRRYR